MKILVLKSGFDLEVVEIIEDELEYCQVVEGVFTTEIIQTQNNNILMVCDEGGKDTIAGTIFFVGKDGENGEKTGV